MTEPKGIDRGLLIQELRIVLNDNIRGPEAGVILSHVEGGLGEQVTIADFSDQLSNALRHDEVLPELPDIFGPGFNFDTLHASLLNQTLSGVYSVWSLDSKRTKDGGRLLHGRYLL